MASGFVLSAAAPDAEGGVTVRLVGDVAGTDGEGEKGGGGPTDPQVLELR